jgi:hypothetical protein
MLGNKVKSLLSWSRGRPLKTLILLVVIESFVLLSLLGVFIWLVATR